ncbi:MAG: DUF4242 domain-containing protein [Gemmatimonadaceae bacterium]
MRRFIIERDLTGAGALSETQLKEVRQTSNAALAATGPGIIWVESLVTQDRIFCQYMATDEDKVREHARRAGIPCTAITEVKLVVDPMTVTVQEQ